jgi:hypothetical protein
MANEEFEKNPPPPSLARTKHITNIAYVHGGYFGTSPTMLTDASFVGLLSRLQPDVFVEVSSRLTSPPESLIHWGENSPIVAAYGVMSVLNDRWQNKERGNGAGVSWQKSKNHDVRKRAKRAQI